MTHLLEQALGLSAGREALRLQAEKIAHSYLRGPHGRKRAGQGETFWQFRPYVAGDVPRDIDWRQTAKRDDVFVREREHDAAQSLWLYRDASASMAYASRKGLQTKSDYAEVIVLALAFLALETGERVGVVGGHRALSHLSALPQLQQQLDVVAGLDRLDAPPAHHALCLIASDFYVEPRDVEAFCAQASARACRPVLLQVCDPAEEAFDFDGRVRFEDMEGAAGVPVRSMLVDDARALAGAYREKFVTHRAALAAIAHTHQGVLLTARTDEAPDAVLARCLGSIMAERR